MGAFGWGSLITSLGILVALASGISIVNAFGVTAILGAFLACKGETDRHRPWWFEMIHPPTLGQRVCWLWRRIGGGHIWRDVGQGIRVCRLCGSGNVDNAMWAAYKLEREA